MRLQKHNKIVLLAILSLFFAISANAQMTDSQVKDYVTQQRMLGKTNKQILTSLATRGVTQEQLTRMKNAQESSGSATTASTSPMERQRVNNGEKEPDLSGNIDALSNEREIFGHDIFRTKALNFLQSGNIATPQTYTLGPGDELIIDIYGASSNSTKLTVGPDGSVTIPRIGPIGVSGLTVEQAQGRINAAMGKHYQNSSIKVSVGQTRTITVSVMGEVVTPGTYTLSAFATVFHALYMAGGIGNIGTLRDVKVARNGRIVSTVDIYEYILNGRLAGNVALHDNDVIIVGTYQNLVSISGNVKRPMWYEMKKNESVLSLLRFAGDFTGDAYDKAITVKRKNGDKYSIHTVEEFDFSSFRLADEDEVTIKGNEQRYSNITRINGAVKRPGDYELTAVKSFRGLIEAAGGLEDNAQLSRAILVRMNPDRSRKTISVDLAGIMGGTATDIVLENEDEVTIASIAQRQSEQTFSIEGEVYNPGEFHYTENTTVEDLITMAGGLRESASLLNVEIARRIVNPAAEVDSIQKVEVFTFSLDKDLAVSESNGFTLQPYDQVFVRRSPVYNEQHTVNISGEIMFAGNYTLDEQNVRISDIVKRAGGPKIKAALNDARLVRQMNETEIIQMMEMLKTNVASQDSTVTDVKKLDLQTTYLVSIKLSNALANPGCSDDIVLRDGDAIFIPEFNNTVKVNGEVLHAVTVPHVKGKKLRHYVNEAGGYTKKALKSSAYIIYANGESSRVSKGTIEPGCEIVIPTKPEKKNAMSPITLVSLGTSIASTAAVVVSAIRK